MTKKHTNTDLSPSMEDYLEAISVLKSRQGFARVSEIGIMLKVKLPSVTGALNHLSSKGLVVHERYGYADLTKKGKKAADDIKKRHDMVLKFLTNILKIKKDIAEKDACKIEHSISPQTSDRLRRFVECFDKLPIPKKPSCLKDFL
jgi:DtxR family Mn-dependent transcriptional regulator